MIENGEAFEETRLRRSIFGFSNNNLETRKLFELTATKLRNQLVFLAIHILSFV